MADARRRAWWNDRRLSSATQAKDKRGIVSLSERVARMERQMEDLQDQLANKPAFTFPAQTFPDHQPLPAD